MGYRSEVFIGVPADRKQELEELIDGMLQLEKENKDIAIYYGDWLKWYKGNYKEVDQIIDLIENLVAIEDDAFIVALGEDGAIHSAVGDYEEWVDIRLEINIDI
jgi:hypothetical protein